MGFAVSVQSVSSTANMAIEHIKETEMEDLSVSIHYHSILLVAFAMGGHHLPETEAVHRIHRNTRHRNCVRGPYVPGAVSWQWSFHVCALMRKIWHRRKQSHSDGHMAGASCDDIFVIVPFLHYDILSIA